MRTRYVRNEPDRRENLAAALVSGAVAAGVGIVTFYFARLLLSREALTTGESGQSEDTLLESK